MKRILRNVEFEVAAIKGPRPIEVVIPTGDGGTITARLQCEDARTLADALVRVADISEGVIPVNIEKDGTK